MRLPGVVTRLRARRRPAFRHVFVVTYGRSGSTLVQGLLNTLPRTLVRGENNFYVLSLFRALSGVRAFKKKHANHGVGNVHSAFYGLSEIRLEDFVTSARDLVTRQLLGSNKPSEVDILGFKEVLWYRIQPGETKAFFTWFDNVFPGALYVLNERDPENVAGSGFWQDREPEDVRRSIRRVQEIQQLLRESRPERVLDVRYELLTGDDDAVSEQQLRALAEFVVGHCDDAQLAAMRATMSKGHGPFPFGASRGRRQADEA